MRDEAMSNGFEHRTVLKRALTCMLVAAGAVAAPLSAAEAQDGGAADLANQTANPVASLAILPFQFNYNSGFGTEDADQVLLNVQPVLPFSISEDWNLITRTILPVVWQEGFSPGQSDEFGLGDTVQTFFFSPKAPGPGGLIWGAGPVFLWPTATDNSLGADEWGVGPSAVALVQEGPWTIGVLANHIWSYAGSGSNVSSTFLQPFVNYTWPSATSVYLNTESTYDWKGDQWSVPINAGVRQVFKVGDQMMQAGVGVRYWADSPRSGAEDFGARIDFNFLFPR